MKPYNHAENSARKWGGKPEDYLPIHNWFDQTKAHVPDMKHRVILHNSFGIFLCEQTLGDTLTNSDGNVISVRDIAEQHVIEDLGTIPTLQEALRSTKTEAWMAGGFKKERIKVIDFNKEENTCQPPYTLSNNTK